MESSTCGKTALIHQRREILTSSPTFITGCFIKIAKKWETQIAPENTFMWHLAQFELEINNVVFPFFGNFWETLYLSLIKPIHGQKRLTYHNVSVNSKPDHPPGQFFGLANSPPPGQKRVQNPTPRAYKNELKPHPRGHFSQLCTLKT